jgi:penicillin amidase
MIRSVLRRAAWIGGALLLVAGAAAAGGGLWLRHALRASLPCTAGERVVPGLTARVTVERDGLGIPTLRAASRTDLALATGFVHAQDRFFQMDLLRRAAAGELSELLGPATRQADRQARVHRFRARAQEVLRAVPAEQRAVVEAYARGVNEGLRALGARPFEYLILRREPEPWRPEDCPLVLFAMFLDLQDSEGLDEASYDVMRRTLPAPLFEFLTPAGGEWDAPIAGERLPAPPIPGPDAVDLRVMEPWSGLNRHRHARLGPGDGELALGSNNWAVAGWRTAHGGAILAGDMHLGLQLPNIWYRASLVWRDDPADEEHRLMGITLPGGPVLIAGTNTHIAWSFTNAYGDFSDLVVVELDPGDPSRYRTPEGPRALHRVTEAVRVRGEEDDAVEVVSTVWGPVIGKDVEGRPLALRWVAHDLEAVNFGQLALERAGDVDEAIELANRTGIPAQNFVVADRGGRIAWTIIGAIPRRTGFDGRVPVSWADGSRGWRGWLAPAEYPRIVDPGSGLLWTANARTVAGEMLRKLGDGNYPPAARARQIRDALMALGVATERGLLGIQLDDRALFLERWRRLLLEEVLTPGAVAGHPRRTEMRRLIEHSWSGRASVESVGYRLVRAYRLFASEMAFTALTAPCTRADPRFAYRHRQWEDPLWKLVAEKPRHLLDPGYETWDAWLLAVVDRTLEFFLPDGQGTLADKTWGARNTTRIAHPLSRALPLLGRWLDAPPRQLPGDSDMPRVQAPAAGATQRMVVSPGRESLGIFHMPGGQSGHPLSPHYRDGHEAWAAGDPTPFVPGPPVRRLTLVPAS